MDSARWRRRLEGRAAAGLAQPSRSPACDLEIEGHSQGASKSYWQPLKTAMKPRSILLLAFGGLLGAFPSSAQTLGPQLAAGDTTVLAPESTPAVVGGATAPAVRLTPEQLDQLLGPIALYPDALIALILPSATVSSDVVLAARYLAGEGNAPAEIENQAWDDSVKALAHYPSLVKWLDQNLAWTKQVGEAFIDQPAEVMKSIQRLRAAARAAGTLVDTPEQQVVAQAETISIVPTQPDVIYVPYYDPQIVYVRRPNYSYYPGGSYFSFSAGYPVGFWLGYNLDWRQRRIWIVDRHQRERYWHDQHDWRRPSFPTSVVVNRDSIRRPWTPNPVAVRPPTQPIVRRAGTVISRPTPIAFESTTRSPSSYWNGNVQERADRVDRTPGNRESSGSSASSSSATQRWPRTRTQTFQPSDAPASGQTPTAAPAPRSQSVGSNPASAPAVYNRGNRSPQSTPSGEQRPPERESRSRPAPAARAESAPAVRSAPAAAMSAPMVSSAPVSAPAPRVESAPAVSRSAPASSASDSSSSENNGRAPQTSYSRGR